MNVQYRHDQTLETWATKNGHNWLIHKAFEFLRLLEGGKFLPAGLEERYIHYGAAFADSPWMGRPETIVGQDTTGARLEGARPDLLYSKEKSKVREASNNGDSIQLRYRGDEPDRPNLYLSARFHAQLVVDLVTTDHALDQIAHYLHDTSLCLDGSGDSDSIVATGKGGKGTWRVKGTTYGSELYSLARHFYPGINSSPHLSQLGRVSNIGRLCIHAWTTLLSGNVDLDVPSETYLGGNPFILNPYILTTDGKETATWPIWVPDDYNGLKLFLEEPGYSPRTAAIYLGWALHFLHDLAHPFHAKNRTGNYHSRSEEELDQWIQQGKFDHLPVLVSFVSSPKYRYSDKPVYLPRSTYYSMQENISYEDVYQKFHNIAETAKEFYDDVHPDRRFNVSRSIAAYEYLLDMALKDSLDLIVFLNQKETEAAACYVFSSQQPNTVPFYRLYRKGGRDHFYTTSAEERDNAVATGTYLDEGIACYVYNTHLANTTPLYRLCLKDGVTHLYTTSIGERGMAMHTGHSEGTACYVFDTQVANTTPLYRLYRKDGSDHFYTTSAGERNQAVFQYDYLRWGTY